MFRASTFENLIDKATSNMLLEPDWDAILQICDMIRQKDISSKTAIQSIKRRLNSCNPNVVLYTLQVLESVVKNCGISVHKEVASKDFMIELKDILKESNNEPIKQKILELIQIWSHAFRNEPNYHIVKDTYVLLKMEGYNFPMLKESDAMFITENPPDWIDGENCHNCKTTFTLVQRKHHCRCCGQVFCQKCSSKVSIIPKFGIERVVRVCDECYDLNNGLTSNEALRSKLPLSTAGNKYEKYFDSSTHYSDDQHLASLYKGSLDEKSALPSEYINSPLSKQPQEPTLKTDQEEKEEIELALALSASEAEANLAKAAKASKYSYLGVRLDETHAKPNELIKQSETLGINLSVEADMENELARYLDRSFWENKKKQLNLGAPSKTFTLPSAPDAGAVMPPLKQYGTEQPIIAAASQIKYAGPDTNNNLAENERVQSIGDLEEFVTALRNGINIFVKRMQSNASRGRPIINDSSVQTLFTTLSHLQPKLLEQIKIQEEKRNHLENLQDKVSQIKDARAALLALRDEYHQNEKREAEEIRIQRELQLSQKLAYMRQKKRELMDYQRQVTLQRLAQEQYGNVGNRLPFQYNMPSGPSAQPNAPLTVPMINAVTQQQFMAPHNDAFKTCDQNIPYQTPLQGFQYNTNFGQIPENFSHGPNMRVDEQHHNYGRFIPDQQPIIGQNYNNYGQNLSDNPFNLQKLNQAIDVSQVPSSSNAIQPNSNIVSHNDPMVNVDKDRDGGRISDKQNGHSKDLPTPELISFD